MENQSFSITPEIVEQYRMIVLQAYFSEAMRAEKSRIYRRQNSQPEQFIVTCDACGQHTLYGAGLDNFPHTCLSDECIREQLYIYPPMYDVIRSLSNMPK